MTEIPYPPVFHDWRPDLDGRVATSQSMAGIRVEMLRSDGPRGVWYNVELTEDDACILAASLLQRAGKKKLARRVLERV